MADPKSTQTPSARSRGRRARSQPPRARHPFGVDDAARALTGTVWWADPVPHGRRVGVTVIAVGGRALGVHVEIGPPDARRQAAAAAQGWIYLAIAAGADEQLVLGAIADQRRAVVDLIRRAHRDD